MPLEAQTRLLRVLEERQVEPVGSTQQVDLRVVAATHRDLQAMGSEGRFRDDLRCRLEVLVVRLPALRERGEDVLLARRLSGPLRGQRPLRFSPRAEKALLAYDWPGNVRELRNVVERASVLARSTEVGPEVLGLPASVVGPLSSGTGRHRRIARPGRPARSPGIPARPVCHHLPPRAGLACLRFDATCLSGRPRRWWSTTSNAASSRCIWKIGGNVSRAAATLEMHRQSLQQKIRDLGMTRFSGDEE